LVKQKPTEETKTNIITRRSVTKIHKHETHKNQTDENIDPSDEENTPKNKDISFKLKEKVNDASSVSEYETESFLIESPTDDDIEKSILDHDSDLEPKPINLHKQIKTVKTKLKNDETNASPMHQKESKVCPRP